MELGRRSEAGRRQGSLTAALAVGVRHAPGKTRGAVFRWACNHRLSAAVTCLADNSRHASPWAADTYKRAMRRTRIIPT